MSADSPTVTDPSSASECSAVSVNSPGRSVSTTSPRSDPESGSEVQLVLSSGNQCLVCGDRSSGVHYGVSSCEGCKGFFKRSLLKPLDYFSCKSKRQCQVNKASRNHCQACRLDKCFKAGMKREHERRSNRGPRVKRAHMSSGESEAPTPTPHGEDLSDFLQSILDTDPFLIPRQNPDTILPAGMMPPAGETKPDPKLEKLMMLAYDDLHLIIQWAQRVPGFKEFVLEDQMTLLKHSFLDLSVLKLAFRSIKQPVGMMMFGEDMILSQQEIVDGYGYDNSISTGTINLIERFRRQKVDDIEMALTLSLLLLFPDCPGLQEVDKVIALQQKYLNALRWYSEHAHPTNPNRYTEFILILPMVRTISVKCAEDYVQMVTDQKLRVNHLVCEMIGAVVL